MSRTNSSFLIYFLLVIGIYGVVLFKSSLREMTGLYQSKDNTSLYLPEAKYIRLITFGFERFTADIFWFKAINYFGKELSAKNILPCGFFSLPLASLGHPLDPNSELSEYLKNAVADGHCKKFSAELKSKSHTTEGLAAYAHASHRIGTPYESWF